MDKEKKTKKKQPQLAVMNREGHVFEAQHVSNM